MMAMKHEHVACARLSIDHECTNINKLSLSFNTALTLPKEKGLTLIRWTHTFVGHHVLRFLKRR